MDNLPTNQPSDQPQVYIAPTPWYQRKIVWIFTLILILLPLGFYIFKTYFLKATPSMIQQNKDVVQPILNPQDFSFKADNLSFPCPLADSASCSSQTLLTLSNGPAIGYKGASQSGVLNAVPVEKNEDIAVLDNKLTGKKYLFESVESGDNSCFMVIYTFPSDAVFGDILSIPPKKLATLGGNVIQVDNQEINVIIQVKNTPLDPETKCSLTNKSPEFFLQEL